MTTIQAARSGTIITNESNVDYSPSNSISNLKQKFIQTATKNYVNTNNVNNNYLHSTPGVNHHANNGDSGFDLTSSPNSLNNSSSNTNVNSIINNFTNLNLQNSSSNTSNNINTNGNGHHHQHHGSHFSINGNHSLTSSTSMLGSEKYGGGQESKCLRCGNLVYALERIGPIKGNIYHKTCFKCLICDRQLDLKTYYTNQIDLNERQIYCQSHAPKSGKGVFGADNLYIQNILNGPKLDVMQKVDNKPKVIFCLFFFINQNQRAALN